MVLPDTNLGPNGRLDNSNERTYFNVGDIPVSHGPDFIKFGFGSLLQAALARSQQAASADRSVAAYSGVTDPLEQVLAKVRGINIPGMLGASALGSTSNAVSTGLEAARAAGAGGGFSRGLALRSATQAGAVQSSAVADSLMRGTMSQIDAESNIASLLTQSNLGKAGALSNIYGGEAQLSFNIAQLMAGLAGAGQQMDAARAANKTNVLTAGIGAFSNMAGAAM